MDTQTSPPPVRRVWPGLLLGTVLLGVVVAVLWFSAEVRRTRERQQYRIPLSVTNASAPAR